MKRNENSAIADFEFRSSSLCEIHFERGYAKRFKKTMPAVLMILVLLAAPACKAQAKPQKSGKAATGAPTDAKTTNTDAYIALLRRDVRQEKAEIMGAMMVLNAQDSAKFWPIYSEYEGELIKLNDMRLANMKEYASKYTEMTDEEADRLVQKAMEYQKQRAELLAKTYDKVKQALGGITAARFAQVETQLLLLIDLQITASLPIVGQGS
ncbi:MAG: hypothetical protein JSS69_03410 [Acidobacteria bacterium]|nr:hypothetical protein [Acidobacteriota bacterium]MBS1864941.1 hypothetical protein [Acidobacteriota bacterium]